uniref:Uncharacterized protein n=1 Tax=Candidatus Kentrum sp. FW TaxID=2126338 RepID=A0A450SL51_9GAMM|nr:MAG: hypothetical protein BECKFW1821A_GA0114235_10476 [Candidatus Kentron sp. FW]
MVEMTGLVEVAGLIGMTVLIGIIGLAGMMALIGITRDNDEGWLGGVGRDDSAFSSPWDFGSGRVGFYGDDLRVR